MGYVALFFGIWVLVCWQLIAHTIRENPELHLVYKRPKWMQNYLDRNKEPFCDKIARFNYLKKRIESKPFNPNDEQMKKDIVRYVKLGRELKASEYQMRINRE